MKSLLIKPNSDLRFALDTCEEVKLFREMHPLMNETCWLIFENWYSTIQEILLNDEELWRLKSQKPSFFFSFNLKYLLNPPASVSGWSNSSFARYPLSFFIKNIKPREAINKIKDFYVFPIKPSLPMHLRIFSASKSIMGFCGSDLSIGNVEWRAQETYVESQFLMMQKTEDRRIHEKNIYPEFFLNMYENDVE